MSHVEFDRLLDAVRTAIAAEPGERQQMPAFSEPPKAANDNGLAWPLLPFPEGWYAS